MTTRHTVEMGGQTISWLQSGRGRTVILLHGFPLHAGMWEALHATTPHGWTLDHARPAQLRGVARDAGPVGRRPRQRRPGAVAAPRLRGRGHRRPVDGRLHHARRASAGAAALPGADPRRYPRRARHRRGEGQPRAPAGDGSRARPGRGAAGDAAEAGRPDGAGGRRGAGAAPGDRQGQHRRGHRRRPRGAEDAAGRPARPRRHHVSHARSSSARTMR